MFSSLLAAKHNSTPFRDVPRSTAAAAAAAACLRADAATVSCGPPPSDRRRRGQLLPPLVRHCTPRYSAALSYSPPLAAPLPPLTSTRHPVPLDHYSFKPEPAVVQLCRFTWAHSRPGWQRSVKRQSTQKLFCVSFG